MKHLQFPNTPMLLRSINPRVEKHGEEDVIRADLDFEFTASTEHVAALNLVSAQRWREFLYQDTKEDRPPRFREHCLTSLRLDRRFEEHGVEFQTPTGERLLALHGVTLGKFAVLLDEDKQTLRLHFQAAIDPADHLDEIVAHLGQTVLVSITPPPQGDLFVDKPSAEAKVTPIKKRGGRAFPEAMDGATEH